MSVAPLFMKTLSSSLSAIQITFGVSIVTLFISGAALAINNNLGSVGKVVTDPKLLLFLFIVGFFAFLDLFAYGAALKKGADVGVLLAYVRAGGIVMTAILGFMIFGEKLSLSQWIGIFLCVVGLTMIVVKPNLLNSN